MLNACEGERPLLTRRVFRHRRDTRTGLATMYVVLLVWCCVLASSHQFISVRERGKKPSSNFRIDPRWLAVHGLN